MLKGAFVLLALSGLSFVIAQDTVTRDGLFKYTSPAGYKRDDSRVPYERIGFFSPAVEGYSSNVMITIANAGTYTIAKLGKETVDYMKTNDKSATVTSSSMAKLGGKDAYVIEVDRKLSNNMVVGQQQIMAIFKGKALIFTFSATKKTFAALKPKFQNSLKSFSWLK